MKAPKPPIQPTPQQTATAQTATNVATGTANQLLNMTNQYGADGSVREYTRLGDEMIDNGFGQQIGIPRFREDIRFSPTDQAIFNTGKQTEQNIANIGRAQSARIGDLLGTPLKLGNEATEARLMDLGSRRLNPQFARDEEALRTRLSNSGLREGSSAWNAEMERFGQNKNDAFNQLLLTGRGVANQEMLTERNQPINEISALLSQSQVSQPAFGSTPQSQIAGTDFAGIQANYNNNQMQAYQQKVASRNAMMGGLFGLAGDIVGGASKAFMASDIRMKRDIERVGTNARGFPVYEFRYVGEDARTIGLMAQDVEKTMPDAVIEIGGLKFVDYEMAGGL
jgi:hypothetical protein